MCARMAEHRRAVIRCDGETLTGHEGRARELRTRAKISCYAAESRSARVARSVPLGAASLGPETSGID